VRGVVHEVSQEERQALIDHEDIPGLMPAMTMNFAVYDRELLESFKPGDVIDFELTAERGSFFITAASVVGKVEAEEGWSRMGEGLVPSDPAPPFELGDVSGETVSLAGLAGRVLLVDFIFTRCPGPCPSLTSGHVSVQRALAPTVREATHFVSISIDPERDTPADLEAYARARGADLSDWSFLTGSPEVVAKVLQAYGVGTGRDTNGEIEHVLATFLIDPGGRIVKRYIGLDHDPKTIAADLEAVAFPSERSPI
jgi:protein SCO1/2